MHAVVLERNCLLADEERGYWRYAIACGGIRFIQAVYIGGDGGMYSYLVRLAPERHGGHDLTVLYPLLQPEERQFGGLNEAVNLGDTLVREFCDHASGDGADSRQEEQRAP